MAAAEERARIARELHDVVAHSVSVMVVQAQAAERVLEGERAGRARGCSARSRPPGRQALTELRRLLGLLRRVEDAASLAPQPSLRHLDGAGRSRCATPACRSSWSSRASRLRSRRASICPPTGSSRRGSRTRSSTPGRRGRASSSATRRPRSSSRSPTTATANGAGGGAGHGLVGMRERVALYGGELESGPADGRRLRPARPAAAGGRAHEHRGCFWPTTRSSSAPGFA